MTPIVGVLLTTKPMEMQTKGAPKAKLVVPSALQSACNAKDLYES